jgi:hypothetical protein
MCIHVLDCTPLKCFISTAFGKPGWGEGIWRRSRKTMNLPPGTFPLWEGPDGVVL